MEKMMEKIIIMKKYEGSRIREMRYPKTRKKMNIRIIRKNDFSLFFWIWSWKDIFCIYYQPEGLFKTISNIYKRLLTI